MDLLRAIDFFLDTVTAHNDHPSYLKHVLARIDVIFTLGVGVYVCVGGGAPKDLVHNLLMQLFSSGSSKLKFPKLIFLML